MYRAEWDDYLKGMGYTKWEGYAYPSLESQEAGGITSCALTPHIIHASGTGNNVPS